MLLCMIKDSKSLEVSFYIGVEDDGTHSLRKFDDLKKSFEVLCNLAEEFGAKVVPKVEDEEEENTNTLPSDLPADVRKQAAEIESRGGIVVWLKDEESAPPQNPQTPTKIEASLTDPLICRIIMHLTQVNESKGRERSASLSEVPSEDVFGDRIAASLRILVMGNVDAGKSTLVGALTTNSLDDGRGSCRLKIMKHRHEITSGRTSTVSSHTLGYTPGGQVKVSAHKVRTLTDEELVRGSERLINFTDLCGHEKYLKTTVYGMSAGMGDHSLIVVNARQPPTHMTHQHLNLASSNNIPSIIVLTKIDGCPAHALKNTVKEMKILLRRGDVNRVPFICRTTSDIDECLGKLGRLSPIIETSAVTGQGIDLLHYLLYRLPKRRQHEKKIGRPFEFLLEQVFNVPGVGAVASGFVNAGKLNVGGTIYVGPMDDGSYLKTMVKSAHIARTATGVVKAGQSACLALALSKSDKKKVRSKVVENALSMPLNSNTSQIRRGQVILAEPCEGITEFDAEICVLRGDQTTIRRNYQSYAHILMVRQSVTARKITLIDADGNETVTRILDEPGAENRNHEEGEDDVEGLILRPGCRARVTFTFGKRPEYVRSGMRMLFRDGRVRGVGIIKAVRSGELVKNNLG
ncbi:hypothetical protein TL16_g04094 [Triparma laevis f. inornata]|uniref:Elongation factor Tu, chloroplastic n=1 Tax=Triparma laevis f. inornata TaxID=1714386 RepID=A0A9W7A360_9STRA|nr:hypothetical protein TL16_g04094 [Triparma laevis f. inornata]